MPTKLDSIHKVFYDGRLGKVSVNAGETTDLEQAKACGLGRHMRASVSATAINTTENSETYNFAQAILKATSYALKVNSERGV